MSDQNDNESGASKKPIVVDKTTFGKLKPLTAVQVVTLLVKADMAFGACACGACACGPCY